LLIVPLAHAGLALATSLSAWLNAGLLAKHLKKEARLPSRALVFPTVLRAVMASLLMGGVLLLMRQLPMFVMPAEVLGRIIIVGAYVMTGVVIYFASAFLFGVRVNDLKHP
jgi:putative peptidoglycan lipid II flippase